MKRAAWILVFSVLTTSVFAAPLQKQKQAPSRAAARVQPVKPLMWSGNCAGNACAHCSPTVYSDGTYGYSCAWYGFPGGCGCFATRDNPCEERGSCHLQQ